MELAIQEELNVISALQSIANLQVKVTADPLAYEDHLSIIGDIMYAAAEMKAIITRAIVNDSYREIEEITQQAKIKQAGL